MLQSASYCGESTTKLIEQSDHDLRRFASDSQIATLANADDIASIEYLISRYGQLLRGVDRMRSEIRKLQRLDQRFATSGSTKSIPFLLDMVNRVRNIRTPTGESQIRLNNPRTDESFASTANILRLCDKAIAAEEKKDHARPPVQVVREELRRMASDYERTLRMEEVELEDVTGELENYFGKPLGESFVNKAKAVSMRTDAIPSRRPSVKRSPASSTSESSSHGVDDEAKSGLSPPPCIRRRSASFPVIDQCRVNEQRSQSKLDDLKSKHENPRSSA